MPMGMKQYRAKMFFFFFTDNSDVHISKIVMERIVLFPVQFETLMLTTQ